MKKFILFFCSFIFSVSTFAQWQSTNGPGSGRRVTALDIKDSLLFAGTDSIGIYIYNSGTWSPSNTGLTNLNGISSIVHNDTIFAGVYNSLSGPSVFYSANNGTSWNSSPLNFVFNFTLALRPNLLLAGTWYGVSYSTNSGASWGGSIAGLPGNASVDALVFDGPKIFGGVTSSSTGGVGVFYSNDNGLNWNPFNTGLGTSTPVSALRVIGSDIYAGTNLSGVYKSTTSAANWNQANTNLSNLTIKSFYSIGNTLFAGTSNGIFQSDNGAQSWTDISTGLPPQSVIYSIASDSNNIYIGTDSAVWIRPVSELINSIGKTYAENSIFVYPSVTNKTITVKDLQQKTTAQKEITISDICGRIMLVKTLNASVSTFDIENFTKGIYLLSIKDNGNILLSTRIVKVD